MNSKDSLNRCWGCGKEEDKKKNITLRKCSKCVQLKIVPLLFCSDACLKETWPAHKQFHKKAIISKGECARISATDDELDGMKKMVKSLKKAEKAGTPLPGLHHKQKNGAKYEQIVYEAHVKVMDMKLSSGTAKFMEAIKLDPRLPEAYGGVGTALLGSGHRKEAYSYIEQALDKWSYVILTGKLGDDIISKRQRNEWAMSHWVQVLQCFLEDIMQPVANSFPINHSAFYCQDTIMEIVTKVLLQYIRNRKRSYKKIDCEMYTLQLVTNFHAFALSRLFYDGKLNFSVSTSGGATIHVPSDTPLSDLEAASKLLNESADIKIEDSIPERLFNQPEVLRSIADQLSMYASRAKQSKSTDSNNSPSLYYVGCWVIVNGLQSEAGQKLNRKLGMVTKMGNRLTVQIGGLGEDPKSIRPQNCYIVKLPDKETAMIACMSDASKWEYVEPKLQGFLARMPA